jgi:hypothetical protein
MLLFDAQSLSSQLVPAPFAHFEVAGDDADSLAYQRLASDT